MNDRNHPTIPELETKIMTHFKGAYQFFDRKHTIDDYHDGDPTYDGIVADEYRSGIAVISSLVKDDTFIDKNAFDIVSVSLTRYHDAISNDYPMTARRVSMLLFEMNTYRAEVYRH